MAKILLDLCSLVTGTIIGIFAGKYGRQILDRFMGKPPDSERIDWRKECEEEFECGVDESDF